MCERVDCDKAQGRERGTMASKVLFCSMARAVRQLSRYHKIITVLLFSLIPIARINPLIKYECLFPLCSPTLSPSRLLGYIKSKYSDCKYVDTFVASLSDIDRVVFFVALQHYLE